VRRATPAVRGLPRCPSARRRRRAGAASRCATSLPDSFSAGGRFVSLAPGRERVGAEMPRLSRRSRAPPWPTRRPRGADIGAWSARAPAARPRRRRPLRRARPPRAAGSGDVARASPRWAPSRAAILPCAARRSWTRRTCRRATAQRCRTFSSAGRRRRARRALSLMHRRGSPARCRRPSVQEGRPARGAGRGLPPPPAPGFRRGAERKRRPSARSPGPAWAVGQRLQATWAPRAALPLFVPARPPQRRAARSSPGARVPRRAHRPAAQERRERAPPRLHRAGRAGRRGASAGAATHHLGGCADRRRGRARRLLSEAAVPRAPAPASACGARSAFFFMARGGGRRRLGEGGARRPVVRASGAARQVEWARSVLSLRVVRGAGEPAPRAPGLATRNVFSPRTPHASARFCQRRG
jgi:hypothetical protein